MDMVDGIDTDGEVFLDGQKKRDEK